MYWKLYILTNKSTQGKPIMVTNDSQKLLHTTKVPRCPLENMITWKVKEKKRKYVKNIEYSYINPPPWSDIFIWYIYIFFFCVWFTQDVVHSSTNKELLNVSWIICIIIFQLERHFWMHFPVFWQLSKVNEATKKKYETMASPASCQNKWKMAFHFMEIFHFLAIRMNSPGT